MPNETLDRIEQTSTSRALTVPRQAPDPIGPGGRAPPLAGFLTQLLACRSGLPSYRPRRQTSPEEASSAYHAGHALGEGGVVLAVPVVNRIL